ncbi:MAG: class I SAM-dependent methyltransferase [Bacteriovoracia bacterium]
MHRREVQDLYEHYPYPSNRIQIALPRLSNCHTLSYEWLHSLRTGRFESHENKNILVAGCGTIEPVVIAKLHPKAKIWAIDLSNQSLRVLQKNANFHNVEINSFLTSIELANETLDTNFFDAIYCTGVLHHCNNPESSLLELSKLLRKTGVLRLMVYSAQSRLWIYEIRNILKNKIELKKQSPLTLLNQCIEALKAEPNAITLLQVFKTYIDSGSIRDVVDGFFHPKDDPISFFDLQKYSETAGLCLTGFASPSNKIKLFSDLNPWVREQIIDGLFEYDSNPIIILSKSLEPVRPGISKKLVKNPVISNTSFVEKILYPWIDSPLLEKRVNRWTLSTKTNNPQNQINAGLLIPTDGLLTNHQFQNRFALENPFSKPWSMNQHEINRLETFLERQNINSKIPSHIQSRILFGLAFAFHYLPKKRLLETLQSILQPKQDSQGRRIFNYCTADFLQSLNSNTLDSIEDFLSNN